MRHKIPNEILKLFDCVTWETIFDEEAASMERAWQRYLFIWRSERSMEIDFPYAVITIHVVIPSIKMAD